MKTWTIGNYVIEYWEDSHTYLVNGIILPSITTILKKKFGNKYALSQGIFSDYAIKEFGVDKLLAGLRDLNYEGFFETQKEAYMQVKLVEMKMKIERMELAMKDALKLKTPEW